MGNRTALLYDDAFLDHETGYGHPERPARLTAAYEALEASARYAALARPEPRSATLEEVVAVHDPAYVEKVREIAEFGGGRLDYDTAVSPRSYDVALLMAGAVLRAVDIVFSGEVENAFVLGRPPGHHATPAQGMGFCLFNNVAIGARYAQRVHGIERVLIVDWDVHHGNGTQDVFYADPTVFYFSIHQMPHYPGTGLAVERGRGAGLGTTLNVPVSAGSGDAEFLDALEEHLAPAAATFRPELVFVSAGFDAHVSDPLGGTVVTTEGYGKMTDVVRELATEHCEGRLVSVLEGGYSLEGLAESVVAHVEHLS